MTNITVHILHVTHLTITVYR